MNVHWARILLDELIRSGVRDLCVAPGSRSTPLVLAAAADPRLRVHSVVDERSAGFLALGMGKGSGRPAGVVTTSGTAGANLYPAVIEASQGEVPFLVLTADRPHHLRDTDANQSVDQLRLFGAFPRAFLEVAPPALGEEDLLHLRGQGCRAVALAMGPPSGPVHLNLPFRKPLQPEDGWEPDGDCPEGVSSLAWYGREGEFPLTRVPVPILSVPSEEMELIGSAVARARRGLLVAGPVPDPDRTGPAILALAAATGMPVLADPLSGARFLPTHGAQVVWGYDLILRSPRARAALAPDLILRIGAAPTSGALLSYLAEHRQVRQVVVDQGHRWKDHLAAAEELFRAAPTELLSSLAAGASPGSLPEWKELWWKLGERVEAVLSDRPDEGLSEGEVLARVAAALPRVGNLLVASSMPIRELDAFVGVLESGLRVFGNRGASGIDGLVSTTLGIAATSRGPTVGVLGDLAFYHDMNGLLSVKREGLSAGFVVLNNDGGGIFETLPVREFEPPFTRYFSTPHGLDFRRAAELYGIPFSREEEGEGLSRALRGHLASGGPFILEARVPRREGHRARAELLNRIVDALEEEPPA